MSSMSDWAKREVELACERENPDRKEGEFDYGCACYGSALKAFNSLMKDGHSGFSISVTKHILNRLIDGKPLTPIEDNEEDWMCTERLGRSGIYESHQCKRMPSLFKDVYEDGTIKYHDNNRFICVNNKNGETYHYGFISRLATEYVGEITMPYMPLSEPIQIFTGEYLYDPKNGDFDTIMIYDIRVPNRKDFDIIKVNRYFKWDEEIDESWVEISKEQLVERMNGKRGD